MENNNQAQTNQEQAKPAENSSGKPQRKLKFKTLDGKMVDLVCDYDIKIIDLKKKLEEIYKIEPIRQRLLNKGKQFKDNQTLDKLVDKDDTIIHLVLLSDVCNSIIIVMIIYIQHINFIVIHLIHFILRKKLKICMKKMIK